jgi:hypothetical protein
MRNDLSDHITKARERLNVLHEQNVQAASIGWGYPASNDEFDRAMAAYNDAIFAGSLEWMASNDDGFHRVDSRRNEDTNRQ